MSVDQNEPAVSVVIPAFNAAEVLPLQLEALASQERAPAFEVVVVDNGSTDHTAQIAELFARDAPFRMRVVAAAEHQGPGYARNVGAAHASAPLLMFADADDVVSQWWICHGLIAFEAAPLWSGGAQLMNDGDMAGGLRQIRQAMDDSSEWQDVVPGDPTVPFPVLMGGDFGIRKDLYYRLGGFDQSLGTVYEDNDFGVRAHRAGIGIAHAPAVRIAFRGKWDVPFRARLARRSARAHVIVAHRYGLEEHSHFPHPVPEIVRTIGSATLMATGHKRKDWVGVWLRWVTALGLVQGRVAVKTGRGIKPILTGVGL